MKKIQFRCHLLSDIILPDSSATEGNRNTLDFIPGNNFLGIAAKSLYQEENEHTRLIFHSGHVRFGDAHPADGNIRSIRIPADIYFPKYNGTEGEAYVYHCISNLDGVRDKQLKQARKGFFALENDIAKEVCVTKQFAIKSAYDTSNRRSEDERLFGYEAIGKGYDFLFTIELDDEVTAFREEIVNALTGNHHVGRSRTAQYGWVAIQECQFKECPSITREENNGEVTVYADGRLIFFDDCGAPTLRPTAPQLGFANGEIEWSRSQVRIFQYAPWNYKRHAFDSDRCGIEKGSVFVVKTSAPLPKSDYVGEYQNEGFGKVVYNPAILRTENGLSAVNFQKVDHESKKNTKVTSLASTPLLAYLKAQKQKHVNGKGIYEEVNNYVKDNQNLFKGDRFASQWGTIRGIAMATKDEDCIMTNIAQYLTHGVAKVKWEDRRRWEKLKTFLEDNEKYNIRELIINLASEMGKKCKQESE